MRINMKKILMTFSCAALVLGLTAQDIGTNDGQFYPKAKIAAKDQYGIRIETEKTLEDGKAVQRFIPFSEMTVASLRNFPYCDSKTVSRIDAAMKAYHLNREEVCRPLQGV